MQKITNKHGLPEEVFSALTKNRYAADDDDSTLKTDYSVSAIISPIQQTILKRRYPACNETDAIDRVWSLFGHIAHSLLEEHGSDDSITEKRFYATVSGKIISGQVDHYKDRKITDYKTTSAYKVTKKSYDDWSKQLNLYSLLCEINGMPVDSIRIVAIIRDWSGNTSNPDYPSAPIAIIPLVKWSRAAREEYLAERIALLIENESLPDDQLTKCTDEERWMNLKDYAVMKEGAGKATKVFACAEDAEKDALARGDKYKVVRRMSEPRRCISYCEASSVCLQHQQWLLDQQPEKS